MNEKDVKAKLEGQMDNKKAHTNDRMEGAEADKGGGPWAAKEHIRG